MYILYMYIYIHIYIYIHTHTYNDNISTPRAPDEHALEAAELGQDGCTHPDQVPCRGDHFFVMFVYCCCLLFVCLCYVYAYLVL